MDTQENAKVAVEKQKKPIIEVKLIEWFDDHFYKINYSKIVKVNEGTKDEAETEMNLTEYFPSVTTKLGALSRPWLIRWYGDIGTREAQMRRDEAAEEGSTIHWCWYCLTTGGSVVYQPPRVPSYTPEELNGIYEQYGGQVVVLNNQFQMYQVMKLKAWYNIVAPKDIESELVLYDIENKDAGTADNFMYIEEGDYEISGKKPVHLEAGRYVVDLKTGKVVDKEARMQLAAYAKMYERMGNEPLKGALIIHTQASTRTGIEGLSTMVITQEQIEEEYADYRDIAKVWERNFGTKKPTIREIPSIIAFFPPRKKEANAEKKEKRIRKDGTGQKV